MLTDYFVEKSVNYDLVTDPPSGSVNKLLLLLLSSYALRPQYIMNSPKVFI